MKIQCDVCEKAAATVICCADEAALCGSCDVEIHAANKLASKHQRLLLLDSLSNKLPRCDICQEKAAFIFCVEDRALFCRECDEPIHVPGALSGEHQRYLATGIRVGLRSLCNKDSEKNRSGPPECSPSLLVPKVPAAQAAPAPPVPAPWIVDDFLQLSDYESSDKFQKESSLGFVELDWFEDVSLLQDQMPKGAPTAAEVPEVPTSQTSSTAFYKPSNKSNISFKKPRIALSDDEEFFVVPDLG
ncbi:B-box zinc finger protein 24 isoform X1 [Ananas comosus]|uniref:B-box zinc finger protein 24 isoform X1 n=1 Tax=Ananas comosus TaxID=4615 RepID=A0A6P5GNA7_ANACO|nr:B-box zinc finger protein 24 isoform X1 [Ananas comosus]